MKILPPYYYKKVLIADNANDVFIDESSFIGEKGPGPFAVYVNEYGMIRRIIKYGNVSSKDKVFEYSNKGNLINFIYTNKKGFKVIERYDYSFGKKALFSKLFLKNSKRVKKEIYNKHSRLEIIDYFMEGYVYYREYFEKNEKHPYKHEYFNKSGLRV